MENQMYVTQRPAFGRAYYHIRPTPLACAVAFALASMTAGHAAVAQQATAQAQPFTAAGAPDTIVPQVVVSTRRSQQSAIDRKKNAATAMDSIVAEDVGTLPDRNIGEAISRIAGIAVDRGDFNEGSSVSVRGNGSELTRVELDGQAVQSAGGSDMNGGGDGRGNEFRQLPADLIKTVDVVKGQTADMTEGSLGGGIRIQTRTGLDFAKPFASLRVSKSQNSLNKQWTPDLNLVLSKKFLGDRLGILLNASKQTLANEGHQFQTSANGNAGFNRAVDIDGSPEKTFVYQPGTLDMDNAASSTPLTVLKDAKGNTVFTGSTPREFLDKAAAAQTKQDCFNAFPVLATGAPQLAALTAANRTAAVKERTGELVSCLNQWNDYSPALLRYFVKRQIDKRQNLDLRADFKVNRDLTVYAKGSYGRRKVDDNALTYSLGQVAYTTSAATPTPGTWLLPNSYGIIGTGDLVKGALANYNPATTIIDATHHLTQFTLPSSGPGTDQIRNLMETTSRYLQLGGKYQRNGLTAEFFVGDATSNFQRANLRTSLSYTVDNPVTASLGPNGTWGYSFANGSPDLSNPANYLQATQSAANQPLLSRDRTILWQAPQMRDTSERTAKLDLTYALPDRVPFLQRIKGGVNLRDTASEVWTGVTSSWTMQTAVGTPGTAGYTPAIVMPAMEFRDTIRGCADTAGSTGTSNACKYGFVLGAAPSRAGTLVLPTQQFQDAIGSALTDNATATRLFEGAAGRPANVVSNWRQIDVLKLIGTLGLPNYNFDCMKQCTASDGKVYDMPYNQVRERSQSVYLMTDFNIDHIPLTSRALPFGWEIDGNVGVRYVRTQVAGTGSMTFTTIMKTAAFDPLNPDAAAGVVSTSVTKNTALVATNHSFMPSYNLAMWVVPEKVVVRYSAGKTVTRPPVSRLVGAGSCTYDERKVVAGAEDEDLTCSTVGNPDLKGQSNFNQNLSLEWYPNKDTMLTVAGYKQEGKIGVAETVKVYNVPVFAGSDATNPVTGKSLADILFDYNTYRNALPSTRRGLEVSSKTAFTFLPSVLRYTGADANVTRQRSEQRQPRLNPLTGTALPPANESRYSFNVALWYDDGKLAARLAVQTVGALYRCTMPCNNSDTGLNSYPLYNVSNSSALPWNPGSTQWRDRRSFIDGKISYKWRPNVEFFVEGRNLGNAVQTDSFGTGPYADGTPNLQNYAYSGRRITIGVNLRSM